MGEEGVRKIPGVDLHNLDENDLQSCKKIGIEIAKCFQEIGFAYLSNHKIPQIVIDKAHRAGGAFFAMPLEDKNKFSKANSSSQGYVQMNREKLYTEENISELRESFDIFNLEESFPSCDNFEEVIKDLMKHSLKLSKSILTCLELGLELERGTLHDLHRNIFASGNGSAMRILNYPGVPENIKGATRCGAHADYGTLTLLFQDTLGGLEVQNNEGKWIEATPRPGTVLINVGELLHIWTAANFNATMHRVRIPEETCVRTQNRSSIVFFFHPDDEVLMKPFQKFLDDKNYSKTVNFIQNSVDSPVKSTENEKLGKTGKIKSLNSPMGIPINNWENFKPRTAKDHLLMRFNETYTY